MSRGVQSHAAAREKYFLLAADCAFFWLISGKLLVYLLLTALSMHYFGLWLDKIQSETKLLLAQTEKAERKTVRKRQQAVQHRILLLAVILHIGVLFALKYSGFAATNVNTLLAHLHIPVQLAIPKYVMPIGISFSRCRRCPTSWTCSAASQKRTRICCA